LSVREAQRAPESHRGDRAARAEAHLEKRNEPRSRVAAIVQRAAESHLEKRSEPGSRVWRRSSGARRRFLRALARSERSPRRSERAPPDATRGLAAPPGLPPRLSG